jgi:hypothetical protein
VSTYYEFKGSLVFSSEAIAKQAYEYLIYNEKTYFFVPPEHRNDPRFSTNLRLEGNILTIDDENFGGDLMVYSTANAIRYVIGLSISGEVIFQDGDPVDGEANRYYL